MKRMADIPKRYVVGDVVRGLREEGFHVNQPNWPRYLVVSPEGEVIFTEIKRFGDRLSKQEKEAMIILQKLGFAVQVIYQKKAEKGQIGVRKERKGKEIRTPAEIQEEINRANAEMFKELGSSGEPSIYDSLFKELESGKPDERASQGEGLSGEAPSLEGDK